MTNSPEQILMPQEVSKDTSARAENAALKKVADIYMSRSFMHGFYRFVPGAIGEIDRLKGILQYGVISQVFAKRIKADYSNNYNDQYNLKGVSVLTPARYITDAFGIAVISQLKKTNQIDIKLPIENILVLLMDTNINTYSTTSSYIPPNEGEPERLRAYRIKQKQFQGIVIIDSKITPIPGAYSGIQCAENIDWDSSAPLNTTQIIVSEMLEAYKHNPSLAIPVYGSSGTLYWPKHISYQDMQQLYSPKEEAK